LRSGVPTRLVIATSQKVSKIIIHILDVMKNYTIDQSPIQVATNIDSLLKLQTDDFVECSYLTILTRAADPVGRNHYTMRLLAGEPRIAILRDLYRSAEAVDKGADLPWLAREISEYEAQRSGALEYPAEQSGTLDERMRYLEAQSARLHAELVDRIRTLGETIVELQHQLGAVGAQLGQAQARPEHVTNSGGPQADGAYLNIPRVTKHVLRDLSAALRESDAGTARRLWR
jgi:hypothetical protein